MSAPCGTSLITRGVITCCRMAEQVVSLNGPQMQATIEIRPRIRLVAAPVDLSASPVPSTISAQELRPVLVAQAEQETSQPTAPSTISAQELKPVITGVEEE